MSQYIQAYFKNEDEAEGARSSLLTMNVEHLEVGRLDDNNGIISHNILHPILPLYGSVQAGENVVAAGYSGTTSSIGVIPVVARDIEGEGSTDEGIAADSAVDSNLSGDDDYGSLEYVLSAKVKEGDYENIVQKLRSQGAYVDQTE
ncbi:hypothetical protein [Paenibacillus segetis]|uniref:Uncharacterized protein n=1 Tax=Paenibacillus segetis TaxID=1325360 RepID=A0ABQ1YLB4_9BACL|nr:hypothetical protein [Paenibacillus segetis]GGH29512.1 hypothetical protein GCM10008013_32160 [Paenibacillus segetis]